MANKRVCPACRLTPLSRYNPDPLCAACLRAARGERWRAPSWLWDSAPMREALANLDLGACVAIVRGVSGLSQLEMANLVGWGSQSTVSRIEGGCRHSLYDIRELLRFADAIDMPRTALMPLITGDPDSGEASGRVNTPTPSVTGDPDSEPHTKEVSEQMDMKRREFSGLVLGGALGLGLDSIHVPSQVSMAQAHYLRASADRLYRADQSVGGTALLPQAVRQFQRARRMVDESDYTMAVGSELLSATGNLAICTGWLAFDGGDLALSRQLYGEALALAHAAEDTELTAHVLLSMAMLATYVARTTGPRGTAREGLRLASRAGNEARHLPSPRLHALVALREANASAVLGDEAAFRSALIRARRELDRGPHQDDPEWILFVSETEIDQHEASGRRNLGDPIRAAKLYHEVLDNGSLSPRNRACSHAQLASALLQQGDRTQAIDEGLAVLSTLTGGVTSVRPLKELRSLRAEVGSASAEFRTRYDTLIA
ncbi:helix-turn-helix transcriptional regulator [Streptosporangium sp. NPDC005286]|uniref:helix-turn-helix domain-containing protein n=1 Tax=Streptosporangium sp. NPDC005286 TaxID=3154463 RepID=UPI0033B1206E